MKGRAQSKPLSRVLMTCVGVPTTLVVCLSVAYGLSIRASQFVEDRAVIMQEVNEMILQFEDHPGKRIDEYEAIRRERLASLNRRMLRDLGLALATVILGAMIPFAASRQIAAMVRRNLDLLDERMAGGGREGSALMPQRFDLQEFDHLVGTLRRFLREREEAEQRWKRAERELVATNNDLTQRAQELAKGRKLALSMMEDAERARAELEAANERLNDVIEEARQSARDAEVANRAKSEFLATMSHEIRTPLNGVIGFIDMIAETDLNEEQRDYVETVRTSGETLMALINDVLDFSKIESGNIQLERRRFGIVRMLRELVGMFFNEAAKKSIRLDMEIDEEVPRYVEADETRLRQILTNLLGNALKFTNEGWVRISVSLEKEPDAHGFCELAFKVEDSGIGMGEEQLRRLFRPFSQGDSSTTRKYGGTGLGLAICKRLSEAMGGRIWAHSEKGEGATFHVIVQLKAVEGEPGDSSAPFSQANAAGGDAATANDRAADRDGEAKPGQRLPLNIVIAEDNRANQQVLRMMLKRLGWDAEVVGDGGELLEYLKTHDCDLIFMDLQMPVMDGIEAAKKIRNGVIGRARADIPIIALTANVLAGDEERCRSAGMDAYLSKPVKVERIEQEVSALFPADDSQDPA